MCAATGRSTRPAATPVTMVDNDRVRVTEWSFAPGQATGWHVHEYDYVVTPITSQPVDIEDAEGRLTRVQMTAGKTYYREAGVAHDVINAGEGALVFVETELKEPRRA